MNFNKFKVITIITMNLLWGVPQNATSQKSNNKVKKVEYLGYKYKGQVNADKIPDGEGQITIGNLIINGFFNGTTVSDAKVTNENGTRFEGNISFDANNQIELKSGGVYVVYYRNIYHTKDRLETRDTLSQDRKVDSNNFEPSSASITRELSSSKISSSLNPPSKFYYKVPLRKGEYTIYGSPEKHIGFIDDTNDGKKDEDRVKINKIKDCQGRLWTYSRSKSSKGVVDSYRVMYPDKSYFSHVDGEYDSWKIYYPDGKSLTSQGRLTIPEGVLDLYYPHEYDGANVFVKLNGSKTIPNTKSSKKELKMEYKNNDISAMSNDAIKSFVKEKLMPYINANGNTSIKLTNKDHQEIGVYYYENDKFVSEIERKKEADAKEAAEEKARKAKEAAEEKAYQAEIASFTKRFGFNPVGKKVGQLTTVGRSFKLLREWNAYVASHYALLYSYMRFNLSIDHGNSKCYDMILDDMRKVGYIWVRGDKVSSVVWY